MKEYILKLTQLSKYAPTMVVNSRAKMNKFVKGISDLVLNECRSAMLILSMEISCPMVHVEQIDEKNLKQVRRELKRSNPNVEISSRLGLRYTITEHSNRSSLIQVPLMLQIAIKGGDYP